LIKLWKSVLVLQRSGDLSMTLEFLFGNRKLEVQILLEERPHLSITVHPDLQVIAKAPLSKSHEVIERRIKRKASWIIKQLNYFEQFHPIAPERRYVSGETHYYLGRQYRLRIRKDENQGVKLIGKFFEMRLHDPKNVDKAKDLMLEWYKDHAKLLLAKRTEQYLPAFIKLGAEEPVIKYRRMKSRWGSCASEKGTINLNTELVKAPLHSIDYVIVHELVHLLCPNHDNKFYRLLNRILPDWEKRKERLERVVL
jgi:predicted metal-dependent hydrolase